MYLNLFLYSFGASLLIGTIVGGLSWIANRERRSVSVGVPASIDIVKHTEDERAAMLAELGPAEPMTPEERSEAEWDAEWHVFWASHEETLEHGRDWLTRMLDEFAPGWHSERCELRSNCSLCPESFEMVREVAGVIVAPAAPVDYDTAEYAMVGP